MGEWVSVYSASTSAVLEVNPTHEGHLQFSPLIAAWDKQTNKLTGRLSWACACHLRPDLNLICLSPLIFFLNAAADVEPSSQPFCTLFERGEILINGAFFRQWACGRMALGIFDRIKWLTQKRKFCRLWNNPPILISSTSSSLLIYFFFPFPLISSTPLKWIEVKWESVFSGWF